MPTLLLIANPAASAFTGGLHRTVVATLRRSFEVETAWPTNAAEVEAMALQAAQQGVDVVAAMGGDGVVHHVANGIAGSATALGIIPAGTTNVLARVLGISAKPVAAARFLARRQHPVQVPLARVSVTTPSATTVRYATFATGVGLDAEMVRVADQEPYRKYRFGGLHYARTTASVVLNDFLGRPPNLRVTGGGRAANAVSVLVQLHAPYTYFGRFPLAVTRRHPERLAVLIVERITLLRLPSIVVRAAFGWDLSKVRGVHVWEDVDDLMITAEPPGRLQADGESLGEISTARISAAPGALRVIAPAEAPRPSSGRYATPLPVTIHPQPGTLVAAFQQRTAEWSDQPAWVTAGEKGWITTTWGQARSQVEELAAGLIELGVERGDRIAISGANHPDWVALDYAVQHAGAVSVPLYQTLSESQISYIAQHSGSRLLFAGDKSQLDKARRADLPAVERLLAGHLGDVEEDGMVGLGKLRRLGRERLRKDRTELDRRIGAVTPDEVFTIVYTSGTTGPPKGTALTHHNAIFTVQRTVERLRMNRTERFVSYLPLSHVFERLVTTMLIGADYPVRPVYHFVQELSRLPELLLEARPTVFVGVPRTWEKLRARIITAIQEGQQRERLLHLLLTWAMAALRRRDAGRRIWPHLRAARFIARRLIGARALQAVGLDRCWYAVSGAAPLGSDVQYFFQALGLPLHQGWGMTETTAATAVQAPDDLHVGAVGRPLDGLEVRLADDGEILVRGGSVFSGYYREPERTAEVLDSSGWLHTGDIGEQLTEGRLRIVDRKRDIIITAGGKNVAPQEIEKQLKSHAVIEEAMVAGEGKPYLVALLALGAEESAAYLRHHDVPATESDAALERHVESIVHAVNHRFSRAERIRRWTVLSEGFPPEVITPTMKLRRAAASELLAGQIDRLYG